MSSSPDLICDTTISIKWLEKTLAELATTDSPKSTKSPKSSAVIVTSWSAEKIAIGMGFLSHIILVKMTWSKSTGGLPKSVILKIPTMESINDVFDKIVPEGVDKDNLPPEFASQVHTVECNFYNLWSNTTPPPCKIPRCYLAQPLLSKQQTGLLIFEDLSAVSTVGSLVTGLNLQQMLQVAENIASMHAWSLTHNAWQDKFPLPNLKDFETFTVMMRGIFDEMKQEHPEIFPASLVDPLYEHCTNTSDYFYALSLHKEFNAPPVLCQGDLWINNILFRKEIGKDGKPCAGDELVAIIDWQLAHPGSAAEDFSRCICTSTTETVRREHLTTIMQHYYTSLKANLPNQQDPPFTFDTLMKSWERLMKFGMLGGLGPMIMLPKMDPVIASDKETVDRMLVRAKCLIEDAMPFLTNKLVS